MLNSRPQPGRQSFFSAKTHANCPAVLRCLSVFRAAEISSSSTKPCSELNSLRNCRSGTTRPVREHEILHALREQELDLVMRTLNRSSPALMTVWFLVGSGGMDYGYYYWGLYRDYYRDPFPHSLLSTRQMSLADEDLAQAAWLGWTKAVGCLLDRSDSCHLRNA